MSYIITFVLGTWIGFFLAAILSAAKTTEEIDRLNRKDDDFNG